MKFLRRYENSEYFTPKTVLIFIIFLGTITIGGDRMFRGSVLDIAAAPTVIVGQLQGGCYLDTPTVCKIHIEPLTIGISPGESLLGFQLTANERLLYDFGTSIEFTPVISYTSTTVALNFAASCGQAYTLELHALDTGDLDFVTIGETQQFTCPAATHKFYLPFVER